MKETLSFVFIFLIIVLCFGNAMFILSILERPDDSKDKITGSGFFTSFVFAFRGSLGEMYFDLLNNTHNPTMYSILQVF